MKVRVAEASSAADRAATEEFRAAFADAGDRLLYAVDHDLEWDAERYILVARDGRVEAEGMGASFTRILGAGTGWQIGGVAKLTDLLVDPSARRSGVGRALVAEFERRARASGCHRMHVVTVAGSVAEAFWVSMAFSVAARLPDHYFRREHVVMTRQLR